VGSLIGTKKGNEKRREGVGTSQSICEDGGNDLTEIQGLRKRWETKEKNIRTWGLKGARQLR